MGEPGQGFRVAVGIGAAVMHAERPPAQAPIRVDGAEESLIMGRGDHGQGAFRMEEDGFRDMPDGAVDRDRGRPRLMGDTRREPFQDGRDIVEINPHFFRPILHVQEDGLAAEIEGQVEHARPVDVADDIAEFRLQGVDERMKAPGGGAPEGRLDVERQIAAARADDLRRRVFEVIDPAAQHLRNEKAGGVVDGPDDGEIAVPILAEAQIPEPFIKHLLHAAFGLDAAHRMIEEILIERDPGVAMPPGRVEDDVDRQGAVGEGIGGEAGHGPEIVRGKGDRVNRPRRNLGLTTNDDDEIPRPSTDGLSSRRRAPIPR